MRQRLRKKCLGSLWTGFQIPHELVEHERAEVPSFTTLLRPQINRQPWQINCQISDACVPARLPLPRPLPRLFPHRLYLAAWGLLIDGGGGDFVTGGGYAGTSNEWRIRRGLVSPVPLLPIRREFYLVTLKYLERDSFPKMTIPAGHDERGLLVLSISISPLRTPTDAINDRN